VDFNQLTGPLIIGLFRMWKVAIVTGICLESLKENLGQYNRCLDRDFNPERTVYGKGVRAIKLW